MESTKAKESRERYNELARARYAQRKAEFPARRTVLLGKWLESVDDGLAACRRLDLLDKRMDREYVLRRRHYPMTILLLCILFAFSARADVWVIDDTNQLKLVPSNVRVIHCTDLVLVETITTVTTNWTPLVSLRMTNGMMRLIESGNLQTNVFKRISAEPYPEIQPVSHRVGPLIGTRQTDYPAPLPTPPTVLQGRLMPLKQR